MGLYTQQQEERLYEQSLVEEDGDLRAFLDVMKTFRQFPSALADWCFEQGLVCGDLWKSRNPGEALGEKQEKELSRLIRHKFVEHNIKPPRDILKKANGVSRQTALQFCFAFQLDAKQANRFLSRVCLMHPLYPGSYEDVIVKAALTFGLTWDQVQERLDRVKTAIASSQTKADRPSTHTLQRLEADIHCLQDLDDFLDQQMTGWRRQFQTCQEDLLEIWQKTALLAQKESRQYGNEFEEVRLSAPSSSIWQIYLQILGMEYDQYKGHKNRSFLQSFQSLPLPEAFFRQFPDRQKIEKLFLASQAQQETREDPEKRMNAGLTLGSDSLRKLMIFLYFYKFWAQQDLEPVEGKSRMDLHEMFCFELDSHLEQAGLASLYPGHPYDWMFLSLAMEEDPLMDFRTLFCWMLCENQQEHEAG